MGHMRLLLRRHGPALGLTAGLACMVWGAALPAVEERAQARTERVEAERALERQKQELGRAELWLSGLEQGDAQIEGRLTQERSRSPELPGPVVLEPPAGSEPVHLR